MNAPLVPVRYALIRTSNPMVAGSNPAGGATVRRFVGELAALTPFTGVCAATSSEMRGGERASEGSMLTRSLQEVLARCLR